MRNSQRFVPNANVLRFERKICVFFWGQPKEHSLDIAKVSGTRQTR